MSWRSSHSVMSKKIKNAFTKLEPILLGLKDVIEDPMDNQRFNIDCTLRRFTLSYELFLRLLQTMVEDANELARFPSEVFKQAYSRHLIDNEAKWVAMIKARKRVEKAYEDTIANALYKEITKVYFPLMWRSFEQLKKLTNDTPENT